MEYGIVFHFVSIALVVILSALGAGIGAGLTGMTALRAINIAPSAKGDIFKNLVIALALIETGGIIGLIMGLILLGQPTNVATINYIGLGEFGIACATGITALVVGLVSAMPARKAIMALTRQPFFGGNILNMMLLTQSIIQTPVVFGFLISLLIKAQLSGLQDLDNGIRLMVAGISMGIGCIGPAIGLAYYAQAALEGLGINRNAYKSLLPFSFISQAIIETPIIFVMLISMIVTLSPITAQSSPTTLIAYCAAALAIAIATFSPGISSAKVATAAATQVAYNPQNSSQVTKISILSQGLIDATAIYGLLIAMLLIIFK